MLKNIFGQEKKLGYGENSKNITMGNQQPSPKALKKAQQLK
jgi:hypothetical protein